MFLNVLSPTRVAKYSSAYYVYFSLKVSHGKDVVLFVGITCGLSAPYVAGQLEYCMDNPGFIPVLVGFNPEHLARNINIEKWDKTFLQVVNRLKTFSSGSHHGYIINPVVGPEPITGSSRMKSGSATKIILESICACALLKIRNHGIKISVHQYMKCYQIVCSWVYKKTSELSTVVSSAGESLKSGGKIYYLGNDSLALMGLIDASECPPTYGAGLDDVRGFVDKGYETLKNCEGDLSYLGKYFKISLENFCSDVVTTDKDTIIVLNSAKRLNVPSSCMINRGRKILITFEKVEATNFDQIFYLELPNEINDVIDLETRDVANQMLREMAVKWCLNAITTGAHVIKGKVYCNIMIDVRVSNNKLFHRAVGILERLGKLTKSVATDYLLRSIYDIDDVTEDITNRTIAEHIATATDKDKVVPVALVSAVSKLSIHDAKQALYDKPVIRTAIDDVLKTNN
ncbi:hypothetical protein ACF0H5_004235 [Mactra antiquata]